MYRRRSERLLSNNLKKQTEQNRRKVKRLRIGILPDDILLEIFVFYVNEHPIFQSFDRREIEAQAWQLLVHVCRQWRNIIFQSPRRLNLQLFCSPDIPARHTLHTWPALPLVIGGSMTLIPHADNIIEALGQSNRVRKVFLSGLADSQLVTVLAAMEEPYPELTEMRLWSRAGTLSAIPVPDSFLGGSAPLLQDFSLSGIPFPGFPKLLLSATHLVYLELSNIPHSGYISPEAIVAPLSALSSLKILTLEFRSPQSRPDLETPSLPPPKRSIFPALDEFRFKGVTEYLEEFVTRIDAPQLNEMHITFFNQIVFYCPRLAQFINCTPTLRALDEAHVEFNDSTASVALRCRTSKINFGGLRIDISCREPDWQLWSIAQFCNSSLPPLSMVEDLHIVHRYSKLVWKNDATESTLWLEVLLPSTMLKNLFLHEEFAPGIADALQELIGSRITAVLPSLQNIFVKGLEPLGPYQENLRQFVAARLHSGHPISISVWDTGRM